MSIKRNARRIITAFALTAAGVTTLSVIPSSEIVPAAQADPGTPYYYICRETSDEFDISLSDIWGCYDTGPDFVNKYSRYTGKRVGYITGDCANYAHQKLGWRDMQKTWNRCLTHQYKPSGT